MYNTFVGLCNVMNLKCEFVYTPQTKQKNWNKHDQWAVIGICGVLPMTHFDH